jgi:hypothetical protein
MMLGFYRERGLPSGCCLLIIRLVSLSQSTTISTFVEVHTALESFIVHHFLFNLSGGYLRIAQHLEELRWISCAISASEPIVE